MVEGKKTYQIVINGIQESIDAVESLNRQLDALEKRIGALSSKSVNLNGSTGKNGGLDAESKLQRQIINQEDKIIAARKEGYQILLKQKQEFKEINQMQKDIVAQERLQADAYANTMNGLKLKLSDIKASMGNMEIGGDDFKNYQKQANEITNKLKELEAGYGQFGRNVGNYANGVAEGLQKVVIKVGDAERTFNSAREASRTLNNELKSMALNGQQNTKEYKDLNDAVKRVNSTIQDTAKSSAFMDNMLDTMEGFTAIGSIGVGFSRLFNIDDGEFNDTMQKFASLTLAMQGIEKLKLQMQKDEGMGKIFNVMSKPFDALGKKISEFAKKAGDDIDDFIIKRTKAAKELAESGFEYEGKKDGSYVFNNKERNGKLSFDEEDLEKIKELNLGAGKFIDSLKSIKAGTKIIKGIATAANIAGKAIKGMLSLGIGMVFIEILTKVMDTLTDFIKSLNTTKLAAERAAEGMKALNRELEVRRELLGASYLKGQLSDEQYLKELYDAQTNALIKQNEALRVRARANKNDTSGWGWLTNMFDATQNTEYSGNRINPEGTTVGRGRAVSFLTSGNDLMITIKNTKELEKAWKECNEAIAEGKDYFDKWSTGFGGWWHSLWANVKDTEEVMRGLGNVALGDFTSQFDDANRRFKEGKINADQYAAELRKLKKEMDGSEVLNSVIANLDKYIPDEGVREAVQNIINEIIRLDDAFNMTSEGQIHYWNQVRIDAMKDGMKKEMAQIQENERHEVVEYGKTQEQINLIHAKYQRQRLNAQDKANKEAQSKAKEHNRKLRDAENELIALRIENMKDGLEKQLAQIENDRRLAIQKANENGVRAGDIIIEINKKYDKKVLDEKRKWAYEILKIYEDLDARIEQVNRSTFEKEAGTAEANVERRKNQDIRSAGYSAITPSTYDNTKDLEAYYQKVYDIEKAALDRQSQIRQESLDRELDYNKKEEELRHNRAIDMNGGEFIQQLRAGKITQEQYDELIEKENAAHYARMNALDKEYASNTKDVTENNLKDTQALYEKYFNNIINRLRNDKAKIDEIASKPPVTDKNGWNIVNIGKTSENYKKALADYDKLKNDIIAKQRELDAALKANQISPEDFAMKKSELDSEMKAINQSIEEVGNSQKMLIANFVQSIQPYIQATVQSFNTIMQAVWDAQDAEFEKEQEALDKEIAMLEEKYDKQRELTQKYADDVSAIEDELANSRGDRRQHLIDQLNAEIAAQRASWAEEKKIEKEKEKAQAKQDELEKKRKKAQYKRDMIQAVVNGAMAVTMAAINSWPIPAIPMMALAAATTAAQLAIMASHKPYAKGGLLEGKSHKQGGIPVGNTGIEVEGKEYIIRKESTTPNVPLLDYINNSKRKLSLSDMIDFYSDKPRKTIQAMKKRYDTGGVLPTELGSTNDRLIAAMEYYAERPTVVEVREIINKTDDVKRVRVLAGGE